MDSIELHILIGLPQAFAISFGHQKMMQKLACFTYCLCSSFAHTGWEEWAMDEHSLVSYAYSGT